MCVRVMWCGKRMIIYTTSSWLFYTLVDSQIFMKIYPYILNFPPLFVPRLRVGYPW